MITWVTVWVLTVGYFEQDYHAGGSATYQLQYATQDICEKQKGKHLHQIVKQKRLHESDVFARCDFQQIPVVTK